MPERTQTQPTGSYDIAANEILTLCYHHFSGKRGDRGDSEIEKQIVKIIENANKLNKYDKGR